MALGAVLGAALNSGAAHPYGLFMNGLDVIKEPATPSRYGVPTDSIEVVEAGGGGVSTLRYTIDDPSKVLNFYGDEEVVLWDFTRDVPMFGGYIDSITQDVDFGQIGRTWTVQCSGYETLLDTIAMPSMVVNFVTSPASSGVGASAMNESDMIMQLAAQTPLNNGSPLVPTATQALPVGYRKRLCPTDVTVDFSGMSVRAGFDAYTAIAVSSGSGFIPALGKNAEASAAPDASVWLTVDFYKGVRFNWFLGSTQGPGAQWFSDYGTLTVTDTPGGTLAAEGLTYSEDRSPSAIVNGVYVKGASAAGSGFVGTGRTPRREVSVSSSGTTGDTRSGAAFDAMTGRIDAAGRGSFSLTSYTPVNGIHPGSPLAIDEASLTPNQGALARYMITEIRKTLNSGLTQNWTISYMSLVNRQSGLSLSGSNAVGQASAMATIASRT